MSVQTKDRPDSMYLSRKQVHDFVDLMQQIGWVSEELDTTLTRQTQFSSPYESSKSNETPVVFHESASDAALDLHGTLMSWVTAICDHRQLQHPGWMRAIPLSRWLSRNVGHLAVIEEAEDCIDELRHAVKRCIRVVDRPMGRIYVGPCGDEGDEGRCGSDLYASPLKPEVKCRECGATHEVEKRRQVLREEVRMLLGTATEIARLLPWILDAPVKEATIRKWASRGKLEAFAMAGEKRPAYRIGDVIDLHIDAQVAA